MNERTDATPPARAPAPETSAESILPGDRALLVAVDRELLEPPDGMRFERFAQLPRHWSREVAGQLRALPASAEHWRQFVGDVDEVVSELTRGMSGPASLHVFIMAPHSVALLVGQRLNELCRDLPLTIHHWERDRGWRPFSLPTSRWSLPAAQSFFSLEVQVARPGRGTVVSIETPWEANPDMLFDVANRVRASHVYRLRPRAPGALIGSLAQAMGALQDLAQALKELHAKRPGEPVHLISSAPVALLLGLGHRFRRTVYPEVVFHQFIEKEARYFPVLNIISGEVVPEGRYRIARPVQLFISYARKDQARYEELESHLAPLKSLRLIESWHSGMIAAGLERKQQIDGQLAQAQILLLLVSPDYLASEEHLQGELMPALRRHQADGARIIPVHIRPCDWSRAPFAHLQALPRDLRPVEKWSSRDEAWLEVVQGIGEAVEQLWQAGGDKSRNI